MSNTAIAIAPWVCLTFLGAKVWHDVVAYLYFRERMRICRGVLTEGMRMVQQVYIKDPETVARAIAPVIRV